MWKSLPKMILASASPRRTALLTQIGIEHEVLPSDFFEERGLNEAARAYAQRNAAGKAESVLRMVAGNSGRCLILAADTIVVFQGDVLEKPADHQQARVMLTHLSGQEHEVISAIHLIYIAHNHIVKTAFDAVHTIVRFRVLNPNDIDAYIQTGEPMDKAGAYGAQGLGAAFVESIQGSYSNVVGLPLAELVCLLESQLQFKMF